MLYESRGNGVAARIGGSSTLFGSKAEHSLPAIATATATATRPGTRKAHGQALPNNLTTTTTNKQSEVQY